MKKYDRILVPDEDGHMAHDCDKIVLSIGEAYNLFNAGLNIHSKIELIKDEKHRGALTYLHFKNFLKDKNITV